MPNIVDNYREKFAKMQHVRHRFIMCMVLLAVIVVIVVFYSLRLSGIAKVNDVSENIADFADGTADVEIATDWEATLPTADEMTGQFTDDLVLIAQSQIGYHESTLNFALSDDETTHYGYTRYGQWLGNPYQPTWDATFVAWCLNYAGLDEEQFSYNSGTYAWYVELSGDDETDAEECYLTETPEVGELIFLDTTGDENPDRMGIVSAITESNESDSGETELTVITGDYDDCVCEVTYYAISPAIVTYVALPEPKDDEILTVEEAEDAPEDTTDAGESIDLEVVSDEVHMLAGNTATIDADDDDAYAESIVHGLTYPSNDADDLPQSWKEKGYDVYTSSSGAVENSSTKTEKGSYGFLIFFNGTSVSWGGWDDSAGGVVIKTPIDNVLYDNTYSSGTGYFYIPVSWCEEAYDFIFTADYAEDAKNGYCDFTYAPDANNASGNITRASYVCLKDGDTNYWYLKVESTYSSELARINLYYAPVTHPTHKHDAITDLEYPDSSSSLPASWGLSVYTSYSGATGAQTDSGSYGFIFYYQDENGKEYDNIYSWSDATPVLAYVIDDVLTDGAGTYYIPVKRLEEVYANYVFDASTAELCEFKYAPDANNGDLNKTPASYVCLKDGDIDYWYIQVKSTFNGVPDRINLYYLGEKIFSDPESAETKLDFWCYGAHWGENETKADGDYNTLGDESSDLNYDPLNYKIAGYSEYWNGTDTGASRSSENWSEEYTIYGSGNCDIGESVEYYTYSGTIGTDITTYELIPIEYIEKAYSCDRAIDAGIYWQFDPETTPYEECPFWYDNNSDNKTLSLANQQASYYSMEIDEKEEWFLQVDIDENTQNYNGKLTMSLFYVLEYGDGFVLNLGNGNGTISDVDYSGVNREGETDALRYALVDNGVYGFGGDDGMMTITLPSNDDLGDYSISLGKKTIESTSQRGYYYIVPDYYTVVLGTSDPDKTDKELVGWVNIATGEYYDVRNGSTEAEIDLSNDNVFYADWEATQASYNIESTGTNTVETADTSNFVSIEMFDYNNLVNLYSANVTQNGLLSESWADSGDLYTNFTMASDTSVSIPNGSFLFYDDIVGHKDILSNALRSTAIPRNCWLAPSNGFSWTYPMIAAQVDSLTPDSGILGFLFDENSTAVGVDYVGKGNHLFTYNDSNSGAENCGYYYSSRQYAADYNQSSGNFTLYNSAVYVRNDSNGDFLPYTATSSSISGTNGSINYWFGLKMETSFYLPDKVGIVDENTNEYGNKINGEEMTYEFSGDDDVWIFIDDTLVVDLTGVHDEIGCSINFSTGIVDCFCPDITVDENGNVSYTKNYEFFYNLENIGDGIQYGYTMDYNIDTVIASNEAYPLDLSEGDHTLTVYYLERGASLSNLTIRFNVFPKWNYDSLQVSQVTAKKEWVDAAGNSMAVDSGSDLFATVGLFEEIPTGEYTVKTDENGASYYEETITEDEGETTVNRYYIGEDGFARDEDDNIYGYYHGGDTTSAVVLPEGSANTSFYLLVEWKTLDSTNNWEYTWHTGSTEHNYVVLEYGEMSAGYQLKSITGGKSEDTDSDVYWTIIGEPDMADWIKDEPVADLQILITDAGYNHLYDENDEDSTPRAGLVTHESENVATALVEINAYPDGTTYGIIRDSDIQKLENCVWYMQYSGSSARDDISSTEDPEFYIYCFDDTTQYYLCEGEDDSGGGKTLALTSNIDDALIFVYSLAGELLVYSIDDDGNVVYSEKVVIDTSGDVYLTNEKVAQEDAQNVRIYTYQEDVYKEYAYNVTNEQKATGILPNTGGAGIIIFACVGGGMVIIAAAWLVVRRRRVTA